MALVRSRDTKLEVCFRRALWATGIRGWRCNPRDVFGTPDLAWKGLKLAVFLDSAWWHGHPSRWTPGRLPGKWDAKIARNVDRDSEVNRRLEAEGWTVVRFWDFEIEKDISRCIDEVRLRISD
jgi:DNA mismatch endonuclease (patch repair protein)